MQNLELKVPPPIVMTLIGCVMWGIASLAEASPDINVGRAFMALTLVLVGIGFSLAGVFSFRRAKTTVNPLKPETTTSLVSSGVYRVTRNPMYVGMFFVLIGWGVLLASIWTLLGPMAFILYMNRFQIEPEERMLARLFGTDFTTYKEKARRWL